VGIISSELEELIFLDETLTIDTPLDKYRINIPITDK
jgi:hypothetical protein